MDWVIEKLVSSLENLKNERDSMVQRIDKFIDSQEDTINNIKSNPIINQRDNFLLLMKVHKMHSELDQKIFETQLLLESYSSNFKQTSIEHEIMCLENGDNSKLEDISVCSPKCSSSKNPESFQETTVETIQTVIEENNLELNSSHQNVPTENQNSIEKSQQNTETVVENINLESPSAKKQNPMEFNLETVPEKNILEDVETYKSKEAIELQNLLNQEPLVPNQKKVIADSNSSVTDFYSVAGTEYVDFDTNINALGIEKTVVPKNGDQCTVTCITNPADFYITIINNLEVINRIKDLINKSWMHLRDFSSKDQAEQHIKQYCLGYSLEYHEWFRCELQCWHTESGLIQIQLIDFGDIFLVDHTVIREMPEVLLSFPKQALNCGLELLHPPNNEAKWPESSIQIFTDLCFQQGGGPKIFRVEYVSLLQNDKWGIDLVSLGTNENFTIGDALINARGAIEIVPDFIDLQLCDDNSFYDTEDDKSEGPQPLLPQQNSNVTPKESLNQSQTTPNAVAKTEKNSQTGNFAEKPLCETKNSIKNQVVGSQVPTQEFQPRVGEVIDVVITALPSSTQFYCFIRRKDLLEKFRKMLRMMNNPETESKLEKLYSYPLMGQMVLANLDGKWQRARVLEVKPNVQPLCALCILFLVDFGFIANIPFGNLRKISNVFLQEPFFAYRIHISNVVRKDDINIDALRLFYEESYENRQATATFKYINNEIFAATFTDLAGNDIGLEMAKKGFVILNENRFAWNSSGVLVD